MKNRKRQDVWNKLQWKMCGKIFIKGILLLSVLFLYGCSFEKENAGSEADVVQDRLAGVFITTEHLDLFDMEGYLDDNADVIAKELRSGNGSDIEVVDTTAYRNRIYATVDKHNSENSSDWEFSFGDIEGICFFEAVWQEEGETAFHEVSCGDEICDRDFHYSVSDEGESIELTGTIYALTGGKIEELGIYLNPVYQTEEGEIYITSSMGHYSTDIEGGGYSCSLNDEVTLTENREHKTNRTTVTIDVEMRVKPELVYLYQMNDSHQVVSQEEYEPGTLPKQLTMEEETAYIIVETKWADGESTRESFEKQEENTYIETYYVVNEMAVGKHGSEVIFE